MPSGNAFSLGKLDVLFGTEISLKLFVMKPSMKSVMMTSPCL
jgi:hypothetical protein